MQSSGYPNPTSAAVTAVMRANPKRDTRPERLLRSALHARGYRFRKQLLIEAGTVRVYADVAFPRHRTAVFVDGCFWHCCPAHGNTPRANTSYWAPKLARNVERDRRVSEALRAAGWKVVRIWEHTPTEKAVDLVARFLTNAN
jgi:DNA mismatch endonuclease, patch repair protein